MLPAFHQALNRTTRDSDASDGGVRVPQGPGLNAPVVSDASVADTPRFKGYITFMAF
jgi:hypothetical protein